MKRAGWCKLDEHKLIREQERGRLAKQILDNPLWSEAWEKYLDSVWNSWTHTAPEDVNARERAFITFHVAKQVRAEIIDLLMTGKLAEKAMEDSRDGNR